MSGEVQIWNLMKKILFSLIWILSLGVAYWLGLKNSDTSTAWEETGDKKEPNIQPTHSNFVENGLRQASIEKEIATASSKLKVTELVEFSENNSPKADSKTLSPNGKLLSSNPLERLQAFTEILKILIRIRSTLLWRPMSPCREVLDVSVN